MKLIINIFLKLEKLVDPTQMDNDQINLNIATAIFMVTATVIACFILMAKTNIPELISTLAIVQIASLMALANVLKNARKDRETLQDNDNNI